VIQLIVSIDEIKNLGIFKDFRKDSQLKLFSKFNLFYGWNGSGKSTLSKLFAILEKRDVPPDFLGCSFKITQNDGSIVEISNMNNINLNIKVFNQNFIVENINWDETVKSILLLSEQKIDERKKLDKLKENRTKTLAEILSTEKKIESGRNEIDSFLSSTAKKIKQQFQVIDTKDSYYLNYNKTKIEKILEKSNGNTIDLNMILSSEAATFITKSVRPDVKEVITYRAKAIPIEQIIEASKKINDLLSTVFTSYSIERLKENQDISIWVESGLELHKKHQIDKCEFCGETISSERLVDLENHFNDLYKDFKQRLSKAYDWIASKKYELNGLPNLNEFYDEYKDTYGICFTELTEKINQFNEILDCWLVKITQKTQNPFEKIMEIEVIKSESIDSMNQTIEILNGIIERHNSKTDNFNKEIQQLKQKLETHYIAKEIIEFKFFEKQNEVRRNSNLKRKYKEELAVIDEELEKIERLLSNEVLGAYQFNDQLHTFLGRKELSLVFDPNEKGYKIIRDNKRAKNLSEGEKTAIAFVYFITKIKENGNDLSKTIVVIDDPISSFDSNNLFHAYSFLKNESENFHQLFILTHSFIFFRLVRDWLIKKNKNGNVKSCFYSIEAIVDASFGRKSTIKTANDSLLQYGSEYHYLFSKVYEFKENSELTVDDSYLVANLSRKLLEGFLSFKFPKKRNDLNLLLEQGISDSIKRERIYRFINKYSHNASIDLGDFADNVIGESQNVVMELLKVIEELDPRHYFEMESVCKDQIS